MGTAAAVASLVPKADSVALTMEAVVSAAVIMDSAEASEEVSVAWEAD